MVIYKHMLNKQNKHKVKKTQHNKRHSAYIMAVIMVLGLVAAVFATLYFREKSAIGAGTVGVNLGVFEYRFENGMAIKRANASVTSLKSFLSKTAKKDISLGCESSYYNVVAASKDDNQVLLRYGCGYPGANMFAVRDGQDWKAISPTNQFNDFGMPNCDYVQSNNISKDIAPVCYSNNGEVDTYAVRS